MFKNIDLKWKISIILTAVIVAVMGFVAFFTYNYSQDIMSEQINERVRLIRENQRQEILAKLEQAEYTADYFSEMKDIYDLAEMSSFYIRDGELVDLQRSGLIGTFLERASLMRDNNQIIKESEFSYVVNETGIVLADSRAVDKENIYDYIGNKLPDNMYKNIESDRVYNIDGKKRILFNSPIIKNDNGEEEIIGYYIIGTGLDIYYSDSLEAMENISAFSVINQDGIILSNIDKSLMGEKIEDNWIVEQVNSGVESDFRTGNSRRQTFEQISNKYGIYMAVDVPLEVINGPVKRIRDIILIISGVGILLLFLSSYFLINWQLKPLENLIIAFEELAAGNLNSRVLLKETENRDDEIGKLSKSFNNMINRFKELILNINEASNEVEESSTYLKEVSQEVGSVSTQVAQSISDVSAGADAQAESVENINTGIKKLAGDIDKLKKSNEEVKSLADEMEDAAEGGKIEINNVSSQMQKIRTQIQNVAAGISNLETISDEIDEILNIINNIAEQTNLLALNAAIEAARAGEAGRGFSVVADEIRELAEESVDSAAQIRKLIEDVKNETKSASSRMNDGIIEIKHGQEVVERAENSFVEIEDKIVNASSGINSSIKIVHDVDKYSTEIVGEVEDIAGISQETSANTEEVAAASEEQNASIEEITGLSDTLAEMAANLNRLVNQFNISDD